MENIENKRKLASVRTIDDIQPIVGADAIEVAVVGGWKVVVKKGEFNIGDLAVYFEIDSWIPTNIASFLSKGKEPREYEGVKGEKLKTIRLRGQLSQGLLIPLEAVKTTIPDISLELGTDLTEALGILKWEAPISAQSAGIAKGLFPYWGRKTDEERIQNLPDYFEKYKGYGFDVTLKLDGTSCSYYAVDTDKFVTKKEENDERFMFGHCSRNLETKYNPDSTAWAYAIENGINTKLLEFSKNTGRSIMLQGELMGPGIQGNREFFKKHSFWLFSVWDVDAQRYLTPSERDSILEEIGLEIPIVPTLDFSLDVFNKFKNIDEILAYAEGHSINNAVREGLVFKSVDVIKGQVVSFKAISNKFLLGEKE